MRFIFVIFLAILVFSCQTEFEKIRTSNEPKMILDKANAYFAKKDYTRAQALYEIILPSFRGQKEAEDIYFNYSYCFYNLNDFSTATQSFKNFANTFINSSKREEADFMSVYSIYRTSPNHRLDQVPTEEAINGFQSFVNAYPDSKRVSECNGYIDALRGKLEKKAYEQGLLYYDLTEYKSCIATFQNLLIEFPETKNAQTIRYFIVKAAFDLAEKSVIEKKKVRYEESLVHCENYLKRYSKGTQTTEVRKIKNSCIQNIKNPDYVRYQDTSSRN